MGDRISKLLIYSILFLLIITIARANDFNLNITFAEPLIDYKAPSLQVSSSSPTKNFVFYYWVADTDKNAISEQANTTFNITKAGKTYPLLVDYSKLPNFASGNYYYVFEARTQNGTILDLEYLPFNINSQNNPSTWYFAGFFIFIALILVLLSVHYKQRGRG